MDRIQVTSKNIKSVGYDSQSKTLQVEFLTGSIYEYYDVPNDVFDKFITAESKGTFFHKYIKNGGYKYRKLEGENR